MPKTVPLPEGSWIAQGSAGRAQPAQDGDASEGREKSDGSHRSICAQHSCHGDDRQRHGNRIPKVRESKEEKSNGCQPWEPAERLESGPERGDEEDQPCEGGVVGPLRERKRRPVEQKRSEPRGHQTGTDPPEAWFTGNHPTGDDERDCGQ